MEELQIRLFGFFQISVGVVEISEPVSPKAQEFLGLLLLAPQRSILREVAAESLWPSSPPDASKKSIRQVLWQIHQWTDVDLHEDPRLVLTDGNRLLINPNRRLWADVTSFREAARAAQVRTASDLAERELASLGRAADLRRGSLLAGCDAEWCLVEREHLDNLHITMLDKLSVAHERRGEFELAIHWAQALLDVEPAHERSHRRLMQLYYDNDDRTRALRQYHRCRWVLENELGVRPSTRTESLAAAIRADSGEPDDAPRPAQPLPAATTDMLDSFRVELGFLRTSVDALREQICKSLA